jgi:beta-glucosidase
MKNYPRIVRFPQNFYWGAATSAHQVEGGNTNDWSEWEKTNAKRLAKEAPKNFAWTPVWGDIKGEATSKENYISGRAADSWHNYLADFDAAAAMGLRMYRFSVEWSRLEPRPGVWDEEAFKHYRSMLMALRKRGIEPMVTLMHWTLPLWLSQQGGWEREQAVDYFERFAQKVATEFDGLVTYWCTINEPEVVLSEGYLNGTFPPARKSLWLGAKVYLRLHRTHRRAYRVLKFANPNAHVGYAKVSMSPGRITIKPPLWFASHFGLWLTRRQYDFIGLNYYRDIWEKPKEQLSDMGWGLDPAGMYEVLMSLRRFRKPIIITENGVADRADVLRPDYLRKVAYQVGRAIADGAPVKGYLYWSLIDNFEWDKGYWPKFGLIAIERPSMKRTPRPSAEVYANIIRDGKITKKTAGYD